MDFPKSAVLVVDASAFIFRAYYALAPLSSKGRPSHAVSGFASMLLKLIREKRPSSCVVVFDSKAPSFRKEMYPDYKANRELPPPDISDQIQAVMEMCRRADLSVLQQEGFEADDWIASFVTQVRTKHPVVIVSSDKDLAQLVRDGVLMFDSFRDKLLDARAVEEKWGVQPDQMRDYLAMVGDSSDNIPGLPGIGPKTAAKWLKDFKDISGIRKNLDKLPAKQKQKIEENEKQLDLSCQLVDLKLDLPVPSVEPEALPEPFPQAFHEFLLQWDCHRVIQQFEEELLGKTSRGSPSAGASADFRLVKNLSDLKELQQEIEKAKEVSFDIETNSFQSDKAELVGVSFSTEAKRAWYLPVRHGQVELDREEMLKFLSWFCKKGDLKKLAHNAKYDVQILAREGFPVSGLTDDTMIQAHLLESNRRSFSLDALSQELLNESKGDLKKLLDGSEDFSTIPLEEALDYAARDAFLTLKLSKILRPQISENKKLNWLYEKVEMPLVGILAEMESTGIKLDCDRLAELSAEMHHQIEKTQVKIFKVAGQEFNISSPKQLQKVLFEELGLEPLKKTKTGFSTDESVLIELADEHEVPALILEFRRLSKLTSTYVDVLPLLVSDRDQRLHTHYHQTGTATGRLSSSDPNLQNIPTRSEEGKKIREAFVPDSGYQLMSADYSQVELRLMAHFSGDEKMIQAFREGRDIHSETARLIFGSDEKEFRSKAKAINFGIIYGISAFGLARQLKIPRSDAKNFIEAYFDQFPKVKLYMEESQNRAREQGYSETLFGRRRPLPDIKSRNAMLRQNAERISINAPLQGTAADLMKLAMVQVDQLIKQRALKSRMLLQVHDELVFEVADAEQESLEECILNGMQNFKSSPGAELKVPLVVDRSVGSTWADL